MLTNGKSRGMLTIRRERLMNDASTGNSLYPDNFADQRQEREVEKYGKRLPMPEMAAHPHVYEKHSIEPAYGQYDRPISGLL